MHLICMCNEADLTLYFYFPAELSHGKKANVGRECCDLTFSKLWAMSSLFSFDFNQPGIFPLLSVLAGNNIVKCSLPC